MRGPEVLVASRRAAGLTQEAMADRAGVSVRAVRDLETGRVSHPRRATLVALAEALELPATQVADFIRVWTAPQTTTFAQLTMNGYDLEYARQLLSGEYTDLAVYEKVVIGPSRTMVRSENFVLTRVDAATISSRLVVWGDDASMPATAVSMDALVGARAELTLLADQDLAVFELVLDRPVVAGDTYALSYNLVWDAEQGAGHVVRDAIHGFRRGAGSYTLHVAFAPGCVPTRAWEIPEHDRDVRGREVEIRGDHLQLVRHNAVAGLHGLVWEW